MADQILIVPEGFQTEIDALTKSKDSVLDEILKIETDGLELETITQLKDIVTNFNNVIKSYKKVLAQDGRYLEGIRSEWMAVDSTIATHGEGLTSSK